MGRKSKRGGEAENSGERTTRWRRRTEEITAKNRQAAEVKEALLKDRRRKFRDMERKVRASVTATTRWLEEYLKSDEGSTLMALLGASSQEVILGKNAYGVFYGIGVNGGFARLSSSPPGWISVEVLVSVLHQTDDIWRLASSDGPSAIIEHLEQIIYREGDRVYNSTNP